jgi:hypothetical protein
MDRVRVVDQRGDHAGGVRRQRLGRGGKNKYQKTLLLPKTSSMLVGSDAWVWPMWPMLCAMAAGEAFVRRGNAVAW